MITTVTLNPAIDREYFVSGHQPGDNQYIYDEQDLRVYPGGKGLLSAINLKNMGYPDVQNIGFVGGEQGLFFERMVQEHSITTNYIFTDSEIRNNIKIVGKDPVTYTHFNDYTYRVNRTDVRELLKRFKRGIADSEIIMISGSIPAGVDFDIYRQMIEICHNRNKQVYLQASGEALKLALEASPWIVVPYFKHTDKILDKRVESLDDYLIMARELIRRGADYVILPFHCDRLLVDGEDSYRLSPKDLCLRNWLGAGDAYNAGFFDYVLQSGFDFLKANQHGGAAALAIAEDRSIFLKDRQTIEANLDRIQIERLEGR